LGNLDATNLSEGKLGSGIVGGLHIQVLALDGSMHGVGKGQWGCRSDGDPSIIFTFYPNKPAVWRLHVRHGDDSDRASPTVVEGG
jgi:hypothetical protein